MHSLFFELRFDHFKQTNIIKTSLWVSLCQQRRSTKPAY